MRKEFVNDAREKEITGIRGDSRLEVNKEAVDALVSQGGGGGSVLKAPAQK